MVLARKIEAVVDELKANPPFKKRAADRDVAPASVSPGVAREPVLQRDLVRHMLTTYRLLRRGMGWFAITYPFLLVFAGLVVFGVEWQPSISDYYYAMPRNLDVPPECRLAGASAACAAQWRATAADMAFPLRAVFCGGLIALGVFLVLYKGTSWLEDWALNLAGLFAIGVAIFPMNKLPYASSWPTWFHFASAVLLFVCMWFISRFCAKDTLRFFDPGSPEPARYTKRYKRLAMAMLGVVIAGGLYGFTSAAVDAVFPWTLFCIEAAGVVIFGSYWVIKSREISTHDFGLNIDV